MKFTKQIASFTLLLTILYILQWWALYYYFVNVPEYLANTGIKIKGLLLAITLMTTIYFFQKNLLQKDSSITVGGLLLLTIIMAGLAEILFQVVRLSTNPSTSFSDKIKEAFYALIISSIIISIMAFMTAFKLKYKRSVWNTIIFIVFIASVYLIRTYTHLLK